MYASRHAVVPNIPRHIRFYFVFYLITILRTAQFMMIKIPKFLHHKSIQKHIQKHICIHPAGLRGLYLSGVIAYIRDYYDVSDCIFSGASAGSWNALLFSYRGNVTELIYDL